MLPKSGKKHSVLSGGLEPGTKYSQLSRVLVKKVPVFYFLLIFYFLILSRLIPFLGDFEHKNFGGFEGGMTKIFLVKIA